MVYTNNGSSIKGITTYSSEFNRDCGSFGLPVKKVIPITDDLIKDGKIDFYIDAACNDLQGNFCNSGNIMQLETAVCRKDIREVKYDLEVLLNLFDSLGEDDAEYRNEIAFVIDSAHNYIVKKDYKSAQAEFEKILSQKSTSDFEITAHGHGHLDLAWLWPIRKTKRKGARTFSSQGTSGRSSRTPSLPSSTRIPGSGCRSFVKTVSARQQQAGQAFSPVRCSAPTAVQSSTSALPRV